MPILDSLAILAQAPAPAAPSDWAATIAAVVAIVLAVVKALQLAGIIPGTETVTPKPVDPVTPPVVVPPAPLPPAPVVPDQTRMDKLLAALEKILPLIPVVIQLIPKAKAEDDAK